MRSKIGCGLAFAAVLLAGAAARADVVYLHVQSVATSTGLKKHGRPAIDEMEERTFARTDTVKITVTNMQAQPGEYVVAWQFFAKGRGSKEPTIYDEGTKSVTLKGMETLSFDVQSKPLHATEAFSYTYDDDGNLTPTGARQQSGEKPAGYVVVVKSGEKIIALEASDPELKKASQAQSSKPKPNDGP